MAAVEDVEYLVPQLDLKVTQLRQCDARFDV
jgi:hypothetical protein